jgi:hypothetical protein
MRRMLERKFNALLKLLLTEWEKSRPTRRRAQERPVDAGDASSLHAQESQHTCRNQLFQDGIAPIKAHHAGVRTAAVADGRGVSLVKAPVVSAYCLSTSSSSVMSDSGNRDAHGCLAGLCILCVGGRAALYPSYRSLVEGSGGRFLIYRGDRHDAAGHLPALLLRVDAVICPVDCVNHASFFHVKQHCMRFSKPCALLERSSLPAFRRGIEMLITANLRI